MFGKEVCVYGTVYKQDILSYGGSRIYFDQERTFFLVSSDFYFPTVVKGECVSGYGKVELSSVKILGFQSDRDRSHAKYFGFLLVT